MTPATRLHVYELYHAWRACYGQPPTIDDVVRLTAESVRWPYGYPRGMVWACLWRMKLI